MCGYVGGVGYNVEVIERAIRTIEHRGPDAIGVLGDSGDVVLGHARLAIIDLQERANQPFVSANGRYVLAYNGEIYNYKRLRGILSAAGDTFQTDSDTEVLLYWLIRYRGERLAELDGMFSFALWDRVNGNILLARDAVGEKPLYIAESRRDDGTIALAFGSEIKALLEFPGIDRGLDDQALADYCRFLYTLAPRTLYRGIREVPPGHIVRFDRITGGVCSPYYRLDQRLAKREPIALNEASERFAELLRESVSGRLVSDVDVGLFLSGGIDSNVLMNIWSESGERPLTAFTAEYDGASNESDVALASAARAGVNAVALRFEAFDFHQSLALVTRMFDQPFGNSTALVAERLSASAAERCRVCLVGDGGDEVSAGYPRYRAASLHHSMGRYRQLFKVLGPATRLLPEIGPASKLIRRAKRFTASVGSPSAEAFLDWSSYLSNDELRRLLGRNDVITDAYSGLLQIYDQHRNEPMLAAALTDFASFVPFNLMQAADRTGMLHGLELRSPFLSKDLIEYSLSLPEELKAARSELTKPLITTAFKDKLHPGIATAKKRPFNPPLRRLLMAHIDELFALLLSPNSKIRDHLDPDFVRGRLHAFKRGQDDCSTWLWGMASLEHWLNQV